MEFFKAKSTVDFMQQRRLAALFSCFIFVASLTAVMTKGLNLGLDFTGGTQIELAFPSPAQLSAVRDALSHARFGKASVQTYGTADRVLLRLAPKPGQSQKDTRQQVATLFPKAHVERLEFIGPQVGNTLITNGILAILVSVLATMLYIAIRFEYRFAISAALSLIHDPVLILGVFALCQLEFNLIALAAILTILGYSLNDTIVVYDRVRENFRRYKEKTTYDILNLSINQTLSRTIMTSGLTLLVVIALLLFGGETLFGFSVALAVGIIIGTYSSIYVAGALAMTLGLNRAALLPQNPHSDGLP